MKRILLLSLFCLMFFAFEAEAKACKAGIRCPVPTMPEELRISKAVFSGKVTGIEAAGDTKIYTVQVGSYWKGPVKRILKLYVAQSISREASFEQGEKYLFFARSNDLGGLSVNRCSNSKRLADAKQDLKYLGKGKRPR